jgi:hypothetical protein
MDIFLSKFGFADDPAASIALLRAAPEPAQ